MFAVFSIFLFFFVNLNVYSVQHEGIIIQKGDTVFSICRKYSMTLEQFKTINKKKDYSINIGEKVFVFSKNIDKNLPKVVKQEAKIDKEKEAIKPKEGEQKLNDKNIFSKNKIKIINTFGGQSKYSEGVVISGKPGEAFYSPIAGKIIYVGNIESLGGFVIVVEYFLKSKNKTLRVIFVNVSIKNVQIGQEISVGQFLGYIEYYNNMGVYVIVNDGNIFIPLYQIFDEQEK